MEGKRRFASLLNPKPIAALVDAPESGEYRILLRQVLEPDAMHPVTLGIEDQKGNVEIISGVSEGEQVLNIGLKAQ